MSQIRNIETDKIQNGLDTKTNNTQNKPNAKWKRTKYKADETQNGQNTKKILLFYSTTENKQSSA